MVRPDFRGCGGIAAPHVVDHGNGGRPGQLRECFKAGHPKPGFGLTNLPAMKPNEVAPLTPAAWLKARSGKAKSRA